MKSVTGLALLFLSSACLAAPTAQDGIFDTHPGTCQLGPVINGEQTAGDCLSTDNSPPGKCRKAVEYYANILSPSLLYQKNSPVKDDRHGVRI
ncbi:hypothetical protein IAQ61_007162, partial [Plenodomus lingam]|uniref:Predicted protein n=1 Tax=Leptosphaeria maculans (strain JN3 / isolate v23.1.3 / race Av1-4-5-6-7-8) TaxID=985895 RepID=E5A1F8_LEPMJ